MFRLRHVIAMMTVSVLVGGFLIVVLAMGWVNWIAVSLAIALGLALSWPMARMIARAIKIDDPLWDARADAPTPRARQERAEKRAADPGPQGVIR